MLELRVGALLVLGSYLFCGAASALAAIHVNVFRAFGLKDTARQIPFRFAHTMLATWLAGAAAFAVQRLVLPSLETRAVLLVTLTALLALVLSRRRLRGLLARIARGGLSAEHRLGDILVSDALVSLAGVLVDVVYSYTLTARGVPASNPVDRPRHIGFKTLAIACVPQGIRMKQCFTDYRRSGSRQHLLNLGKYLVANTPHAMRLQLALLSPDNADEARARDMIARHIFTAACLNATCGYLWDVLVDWRLGRLQTGHGLRLARPWYYAAAAADLVLRFVFLFAYNAEHVVFAMQALELLRRGMWCVFRVESEPLEIADMEL